MPRRPHCGLYLKPMRISGMNSTDAWKATPSVHVPAESMTLSVVQNSIGSWLARPNSTRNVTKPVQLMRFAPTELHA